MSGSSYATTTLYICTHLRTYIHTSTLLGVIRVSLHPPHLVLIGKINASPPTEPYKILVQLAFLEIQDLVVRD